MPTYEYECSACGNLWEQFQKMTAKALKKCPKCGKPKARRLLSSGGGMLFKGSGFHTTDYRSASYKKAAAADSSGGEKKTAAEKSPAKTSAEKGVAKTETAKK